MTSGRASKSLIFLSCRLSVRSILAASAWMKSIVPRPCHVFSAADASSIATALLLDAAVHANHPFGSLSARSRASLRSAVRSRSAH
ncbi:hypothetical protein AtDm6_2738 [Acetobacter tropicalis]|uniref:Secreted protein n=1 Tax=Acetobacter tropicalis TaxID=104102 RepID=A0A094YLI5_9PROT|nr:hypothetical protein AtDm6_2738 [Acetobacter tropicalis]